MRKGSVPTVNHNDKEIVLALRTALAERIGRERFDVWFGSGVSLQVDGRTVRISACDQFLLDRVRSQFRGDLEMVCKPIFGALVPLEFAIDHAAASKRHASRPAASSSPSAGTSGAEAGSHRTAAHVSRRPLSTLDDFVLGPSNCVAFTAAQRVTQRLGQLSPLFVYGPTGTGKTHLLEGITQASRQTRGVKRAVLMSSEQFTSHFLEALRGSGLPSFRRKYRDVDLLLVDDLQFFSGKRATIVELKHTVDTLLRERRQLVFAADRPLAEIHGLGSELTARISGGLVCGLEPPEEETRLLLVRRLAQQRGLAVPDDVLQLLAARISGDVRQLGGALNRLQAMSEALHQSVTRSLAENALEDVFRAATRIVRLPDIESAICDVFGIDARSLQSQRKSKTLAQPRMLAMWLARKFTRAAFSEIGEYFGRRSHSTVISAQNKVEHWLADGGKVQLGPADCDVREVLRRVEARMQAG
jgi:chromosomal replication initiator protein